MYEVLRIHTSSINITSKTYPILDFLGPIVYDFLVHIHVCKFQPLNLQESILWILEVLKLGFKHKISKSHKYGKSSPILEFCAYPVEFFIVLLVVQEMIFESS